MIKCVFTKPVFIKMKTIFMRDKMKLKLLSLLILLFSTAAASIFSHPFKPGESIHFKIKVFGIHVGNQTMTLKGYKTLNGKKYLYAVADTKSTPSISHIYVLHDIIHVWMDPVTLLPVKIFKNIREGGWRNKVTIYINQKNKTAVYYDKRNKKGRHFKLKHPTLGILSLIYFVRSIKSSHGKLINIDYLIDKGGIKKAKILVKKGKDILLSNRKIKTLKYNQLGGQGVKILMTDDKYRLPLSITVATFKVHGYSIDIVGNLVKYQK